MSALVEVLSINESRECDGDPLPDNLLQAQPQLSIVAYLGSDAGRGVQHVLGSQPDHGDVGAGRPAQGSADVALGVDLKGVDQ